MNYSDYIDNLKELFGDDLIIKNNLIVGVCPCKGKGKGKCKGNGWQNFPFKEIVMEIILIILNLAYI
jgi:hypothetical protein